MTQGKYCAIFIQNVRSICSSALSICKRRGILLVNSHRCLIACLFLTSCASNTGETSIYSVNSSKKLTTPLVSASELHTSDDMIHKTNDKTSARGDDTFAIFMTDNYLKYLPDLGGVNEVIIVVEFVEVLNGDASDKVTKILGPYESVADGTRAPFFHKALYGPKRMESDLLSMTIKIYEYDLEENSKVGSLIDFIGSAGQTLSVSNPITTQEIKVASELAKTVANTNENDLVLQVELDFVAGNSLYAHKGNSNVSVLPLKAGELVVMKREACGFVKCFNYFNQDENMFLNPVGYLADSVLIPVTAITRGLTDSPNSSALSAIEKEKFKIDDSGLTYSHDYKNNVDNEYAPFSDKTWLRLSIVKGGDPSLWEKRKLLYPLEAEITKLLKNPNTLNNETLSSSISALNETRKAANEKAKNIVGLISKSALKNTQYIEKGASSSNLCLELPESATVVSPPIFTIGGVTALTSPTNHKCFTLTPAAGASFSSKGDGFFQVNYQIDTQLISHISEVKVVDQYTATKASACKLPTDEIQISFNVNSTEGILEILTNDTSTVPRFDGLQVKHTIKANDDVSLRTVFSKVDVDTSAADGTVSKCP